MTSLSLSIKNIINIIDPDSLQLSNIKNVEHINLSFNENLNKIYKEIDKYGDIWIKYKDKYNPYVYIYSDKFNLSLNNSFYEFIELINSFNLTFKENILTAVSYIGSDVGIVEAIYFTNINYKNIFFIDCNTIYNKKMDIVIMMDNISSNNLTLFENIIKVIKIQQFGGKFIFKIDDICNMFHVEILFFLRYFYRDINIFKPTLSKQYTSNKYVICDNFIYCDNIHSIIDKCEYIYSRWKKINITNIFIENTVPLLFINKIKSINLMFGQTQIEYIDNTLNHICSDIYIKNNIIINNDNIKNNDDDNNDIKNKKYTMKCIKWCKKNNIPID